MALKDIESKTHQDIVDAVERYKRYYDRFGNLVVTEQENEAILNYTAEFEGTYDYYKVLMFELKKCIQNYQTARNSLRTSIHVPIRKMRTMDKNRK